MNTDIIPLRLPDYGINLRWNWYNSAPYEDNSVVMNPGEFWAVFFFDKPIRRPGESIYYSTDKVTFLTPKGYNILDGNSFVMN